ncbi:MAG TPA: quinone-dependent dihydroorotate dehydrogenase, partial [Solirubrobacteraceae bacterium]|nr:quinone-dependent dihydroorotate dehydrogenase [Solirubrobacteraceae bacterium]
IHNLAVLAMRAVCRIPGAPALLRRRLVPHDPALRVRALGLTFAGPLGVAAGLDKGGDWFEGLGLLGFGHVEVGTVTAQPQAGNPQPRVFRIPGDRALLNRMGFPNPGAQTVAARLRARRPGGLVLGANVGKSMSAPVESAGADYRASVRQLAPVCDYLVVNVSSPNTPGLRDMQTIGSLRPLLLEVRRELAGAGLQTPLLVKIAPDLPDEDVDAIADLALEFELDGIVAVNTTVDRGVLSRPAEVSAIEGGGISGPPLQRRAVAVLRRLYDRVGDRLVLISVGGVSTPEDAWERIAAGATLVQAYTGFVYGGPGWPARVNRYLARRVHEAGLASIQDLVGRAGRSVAIGSRGAQSQGDGLAGQPNDAKIKTPANEPHHRPGTST